LKRLVGKAIAGFLSPGLDAGFPPILKENRKK
jgi:hypothetical protein